MVKKQDSVWDRIEAFRKSDVIDDVLRQRYVESWARDVIGEILDLPDDDFVEKLRTLLLERTMLKAHTVGPILENNSARAVKKALSALFDKEVHPLEALSGVWSLPKAGPFFSSYMLALVTKGEYIVYEPHLLEGMKDVAPDLVEDMNTVDTVDAYRKFMAVCCAVREVYGFTSYAELHEFLWHGNSADWRFK
jgi:hypothetical protein